MPTATKAFKVYGKTKSYTQKADSGRTCNRHFCEDCGSAIFTSTNEMPDTVYLKGGLFAKFGVSIPKATIELYSRHREAWESGVEGALAFEGFLPEIPREKL